MQVNSYKGKRLEVAGVVSQVGTDPLLNAPEVIVGGGASSQGRGVDCVFDKQYGQQVGKLKPGQTITVQGNCVGFAVNVLLLRCALKTPNP